MAESLGINPGESVSIKELRNAILAIRKSKGMILDSTDHDTFSVGSFFINPILEKVAFEMKGNDKHTCSDVFIGYHPETNKEIFAIVGKYGLCVKMKDEEAKWKFSSMKGHKQDELTLDIAVEALMYPKFIGKIDKTPVYLNKGTFGLYYKIGKDMVNVKDDTKKEDVEYAKELWEQKKNMNALKTFKIKNKTYNLRKGPYGYYLQIFTTGKKQPENISLSENINPDKVTKESVIKILNKMKKK